MLKFGTGWGHLGQNTKKSFSELENRWGSSAYGWTRTGYFLYKYEIYHGANIEKIRKDIVKEDKVSIDHIVAQGLSWNSLGFDNYNSLADDDVVKKEGDLLWREIISVINGIGNLALSTLSNNSSDSNSLPNKHLDNYEKMGLIKTVEVVKTWKNPEQFVNQINDRTKNILNFVENEIVNKTDIWD